MSRSSNTPLWIIVALILSPVVLCCLGCGFYGILYGFDTGFTFQY